MCALAPAPSPVVRPSFRQAHTCFNRIDLPLYDSKKKLQKFLTMAIQMEATGFDID